MVDVTVMPEVQASQMEPTADIENGVVATPALTDALIDCVETLGVPKIQRHLFLCADQTVPKCCDKAEGLQTWNYLKKRLHELGLDRPTPDRPNCIFRTKANCLRICQQGPILVVYPDGVWYRVVTPEAMERIIQEHLLGNQVVEEYAFLTHPLLLETEIIP
jgi:(2Fe-2S) ferredoxin